MRVTCHVTLVAPSSVPQKLLQLTLQMHIALRKMWTAAIRCVWKRLEAVVDSVCMIADKSTANPKIKNKDPI